MGGFDIMGLIPFFLIFVVFYFLILRPQQQKLKKHQDMLVALRRGDRVVTSGGLIGTISKIVSDTEVQLDLGENVRVRLVRAMITEVLAKTEPLKSEEVVSIQSPQKKAAKKPAPKKVAANQAKGKSVE
jgi:preprotein translocase subunit YajC